jgi:hypothetical protein
MAEGYLTIALDWGEGVLPAPGAKVLVKSAGQTVCTLVADADGKIDRVPLPVIDSSTRAGECQSFQSYDVEVLSTSRSQGVIAHGVQIYGGLDSELTVQMHPQTRDGGVREINIPAEHGLDFRSAPEAGAYPQEADYRRARASTNVVKLPAYIRVHLAYYKDPGVDVTVPFKDYVKNVDCS